jgi:hypothetical protein
MQYFINMCPMQLRCHLSYAAALLDPMPTLLWDPLFFSWHRSPTIEGLIASLCHSLFVSSSVIIHSTSAILSST